MSKIIHLAVSTIKFEVVTKLELHVPDDVTIQHLGRTLSDENTQSAAFLVQQQELVKAALMTPKSGPSLKTLAQDKRRVCIVVGDLSLPAPYDLVLPAIVQELVAAGIRPSRIGFLVAPGHGYPILGRGAIHRYGEEIVGDHELRMWTSPIQGAENKDAENLSGLDTYFEAADLRVLVTPEILGQSVPTLTEVLGLPRDAFHAEVRLQLGSALTLSITAVSLFVSPTNSSCAAGGLSTSASGATQNRTSGRAEANSGTQNSDVVLISGGGGEWEETLEEALLSLHSVLKTHTHSSEQKRTLVLAFSGADGIGSAHFALDVQTLLTQAAEALDAGQSLAATESTMPQIAAFDPAGTLAEALARSARVVLFAPQFCDHSEGQELWDFLLDHPTLAEHLYLCSREEELWALLQTGHGTNYSLHVEPLGWRG